MDEAEAQQVFQYGFAIVVSVICFLLCIFYIFPVMTPGSDGFERLIKPARLACQNIKDFNESYDKYEFNMDNPIYFKYAEYTCCKVWGNWTMCRG